MRGHRRRILVGVATVTIVLLGVLPFMTGGAAAGPKNAQAVLYDADGGTVGSVRFEKVPGAVKVKASVSGIEPAGEFHGFHVHAVGQCDPDAVDALGAPSPFFTAGGHFNPGGVGHGDHPGDFPPLLVMADGTQKMRFFTDRFTIKELLDEDGSAVIVHAGLDNLANIPGQTATGGERYHSHVDDVFGPDAATLATGDAGARFACGVITPTPPRVG